MNKAFENTGTPFKDLTPEQVVQIIFTGIKEIEQRGDAKALRAVLRDHIKTENKQPLPLAQIVTETINTHATLVQECPVSNSQALIAGICTVLEKTTPNLSERAFIGHRMVKQFNDSILHQTGVFPIQVLHDMGQC